MPLAWINGTRKQKEGYQAHYTEKDNNGDWGDDGDLGTTSVTMLMTLATTMVTMTAMMPTMMMPTMTAGLTDGPLSGQWVRTSNQISISTTATTIATKLEAGCTRGTSQGR